MLSILTRVGKEGVLPIRDLILCLAGQSDQNFEWCILARPGFHSSIPELKRQIGINKDLLNRTKILVSQSNSRGGLLNFGLKKISGDYFVVLDDDDLVSSNYVASFNAAGKECQNQKIIRSVASKKIVNPLKNNDASLISASKAEFPWPKEFNLVQHFYSNQSPCFSVAFPTQKIRSSRISWDEKLDAVEDWDFLLKATSRISVHQIPDTTGIYRVLINGSRSRKVENVQEWVSSELKVKERMKQLRFSLSIEEVEMMVAKSSSEFNGNTESKILKFVIIFFNSYVPRDSWFYVFARSIYKKKYPL
jgi:glycosyltransferase involved in cell wall biosynthesis